MAAGGSEKGPRREQVIAALLSQPTIAEASQQSGVPERTLYRWLQTPQFQAEFLKARRAVIDYTVTNLAKAGTAAIACLVAVMQDPFVHPQCKVQAAKTILDNIMRTVELDVSSQMQALAHRLALLEGGTYGDAP